MYWAVKAGEGKVIRLSGQRLRGKMPEMQADIRDLHRLREKTVTAVPRRSGLATLHWFAPDEEPKSIVGDLTIAELAAKCRSRTPLRTPS